MSNNTSARLHTALKVAAFYMIVVGLIGLTFPFIADTSQYPEFAAQSLAYKVGAYAREVTLSAVFVVCGSGLLLAKPWARTLGMVVLVIASYFNGIQFAWGLAGGPPTTKILAISYSVVIVWNGLWLFLIYRYGARSEANTDAE